MSRIIVKNRRVGVVGGRVVTDAGGAPCCCGDNPCGCDLSDPRTLQRVSCPSGDFVDILGGARFGGIFLRVEWRAAHQYTVTNQTGDTFSHVSSGEGLGLLCVLSNQGIIVRPGSFSRSFYTYTDPTGTTTWTREFDHTTTDGWAFQASRNDVFGPLAVVVQSATVRAIFGKWGGPGAIVAGPRTFTPGCTWTESPTNGGYTRSSEFVDLDAGGSARGTITATGAGASGSGFVEATWTRDLSCRVAGGPGLLPPGIDPETLRPPVSGCSGCGQ